MKFDISKEIEKAAIKHLKDIGRKILTVEDFQKATFNFNKSTGKATIDNISEEAKIRFIKAMK